MSNIYLNTTIEENPRCQNFDFLSLKIFVSKSAFGEHQLTQISLNFKISCCNLKIRDLGGKSVCDFPIILILKGIMTFLSQRAHAFC